MRLNFHMLVLSSILTCVIIFPEFTSTQSTDLTLSPKAIGEDVVLAAYAKIRNLFLDDHRFLIRIAYVESKFGEDAKTFREEYFGGIWQISKSAFEATQNEDGFPHLTSRYTKIQKELEIDWRDVEWEDCLKPLHSILAAHLKLFTIGLRIPQSVDDQSRFWRMHYNEERRNRQDYLNDIRELEDCKASKVKCQIDLMIVLDGSGSIGPAAFEKAKDFVRDLIQCISFDTTNTGLIIYSEEIDVIFDLKTDLSLEEKTVKLQNARYPGLGTNTHLGMKNAMDSLIRQEEEREPVMIVLTDGLSSQPSATESTARTAKDYGITTFAIGVGAYIKRTELKRIAAQAYNDDKLMQINSYKTLSDLLTQIHDKACATARKLKREVRFEEFVGQNEVSYYAYQVPETGIRVSIETPFGETKGFYSYTMRTPSAAYNDGIIREGSNYIHLPMIHPKPRNLRTKREVPTQQQHHHHRHWHHYLEKHRSAEAYRRRQVYIAIEGIQPINNFTIQVKEDPVVVGNATTTTEIPSIQDVLKRTKSLIPNTTTLIPIIIEGLLPTGLPSRSVDDIFSLEMEEGMVHVSTPSSSVSTRCPGFQVMIYSFASICISSLFILK